MFTVSAIKPCSNGTNAPPTIAKHNQPEPLLVSDPSFSMATENIVGNIIELNNPTQM